MEKLSRQELVPLSKLKPSQGRLNGLMAHERRPLHSTRHNSPINTHSTLNPTHKTPNSTHVILDLALPASAYRAPASTRRGECTNHNRYTSHCHGTRPSRGDPGVKTVRQTVTRAPGSVTHAPLLSRRAGSMPVGRGLLQARIRNVSMGGLYAEGS